MCKPIETSPISCHLTRDGEAKKYTALIFGVGGKIRMDFEDAKTGDLIHVKFNDMSDVDQIILQLQIMRRSLVLKERLSLSQRLRVLFSGRV